MKKAFFLTLCMYLTSFASLFADEGMWFLMFLDRLNHRDMQKMGLQLTSEEIYSINNHSLKDAIVQFNGFCTAEIISKEGLVLTNHHCGYDAIAQLSTQQNNYLRDGYFAKSKAEELQLNSPLFVRFFVRMDNVTQRILSKLNDKMTEAEREAQVNRETQKIMEENSEKGKYTVSVRPFFQGNEYYYFVYQDFPDVRFVGTPTESIGKYGGDTDNWEWPRHTGDFSMFRVYTDKDGNPAPYSIDNIPLKPKHHLPVNIKGVDEGDFAMILGYPGRTNRWMPAMGVEQNVKYAYPAWVEASKKSMDIMKKYQDQDAIVRLNYAPLYARIANYWKNRQGMIDALTQHKTVKAKLKAEKGFQTWANKSANTKEYKNVLPVINKYYHATNLKSKHDNFLGLWARTSAVVPIPKAVQKLLDGYNDLTQDKQEDIKQKIKTTIEGTYLNLHIPLEKEMFQSMLTLYAQKTTDYIQPFLISSNKANIADYLASVVNKSILFDQAKVNDFVQNPSYEVWLEDEGVGLVLQMLDHYSKKSDELMTNENDYLASYRKLVKGLQIANPKKKYYPDANSTLRLSYGKVTALPKDKRNDAKVNNYTTLNGMVKKHKKGDLEFDLSQRVIDLYHAKDYGQYADKKGYMPVNFLTDNDITGGNSGSPVINGKGELIGLAFDGNIEAMAGDVIFDHKLQRTINVDIRFVLWIIEKYAGARNIIDELTLIK